jgi:hypothetical protein
MLALACLSAALSFCAGCASSRSREAKPLTASTGVPINLGKYHVATVLPFTVEAPDTDPSVGAKLANNVALRLENDFGPLFEEIRREVPPIGAEDEIVISGNIRTYEPGSKVARAILGPIGTANLDGEVEVKDAHDGHILLAAPFKKFWGWGGFAGASKGIEEMSDETAAAIANTIARAKGWRPEAKAAGQ